MVFLLGRGREEWRETRQSREKIKAHRFGQAELEEEEEVREERKQFRVELWLELAQKKRSSACVSPAGAFRLNVKLCQQKLYRTTLDRALGTSCLGANFPACRKLHRRRHGLPLPAPPKKGPGVVQSWATWPQRQGPWLVKLEDTPPTPPPSPPNTQAHRLRAGEGWRGGRGEGCLPGNLEWWAGRGACWELASESFVAQPRPIAPAALPAPSPAPPQRLGAETRGSWGSRHQGNFWTGLNHSSPPPPPRHPFGFLFTFFLNVCLFLVFFPLIDGQSKPLDVSTVQRILVMKAKETNAELLIFNA